METIKQYLETMFVSLPDTPEVQRAKEELLQMMEDKYNELLAEGKSDNEAVGTVIAEFGNLDEIAEELGIRGAMNGGQDSGETAGDAGRHMTAGEAGQYLRDNKKHAFRIALGVLLCICSVIGPVMVEAVVSMQEIQGREAFGVLTMMGMIAVAVFLFVYSGLIMKKWLFIRKESFYLDFSAKQRVMAGRERFRVPHAMLRTIGIVLCVISFMPAAVLDEMDYGLDYVLDLDEIGAVILFIFVGVGVFLIVYGNMVDHGFERLLAKTGNGKKSGTRKAGHTEEEKYISPGAEAVMSVYWHSVTCIYLIWSSLTFHWHYTWIVWPVAGIVYAGLSKVLKIEEEDL